jgi:hypothetical protein
MERQRGPFILSQRAAALFGPKRLSPFPHDLIVLPHHSLQVLHFNVEGLPLVFRLSLLQLPSDIGDENVHPGVRTMPWSIGSGMARVRAMEETG